MGGPGHRSSAASRKRNSCVKETKKPRLAARLVYVRLFSLSMLLVLDGAAETGGRLARRGRVEDAGNGRIGERLEELRLERGRVPRLIVEDRAVHEERRAAAGAAGLRRVAGRRAGDLLDGDIRVRRRGAGERREGGADVDLDVAQGAEALRERAADLRSGRAVEELDREVRVRE